MASQHDTLLGMSKGQFATAFALLVAVLATVAVGILAWALASSTNQVQSLQKTVDEQHNALVRDRHVLDELCKTNSYTEQALAATVALLKEQIRSGELPAKVVAADRDALDAFEVQQLNFAQQTACPEVKP